MYQTQKLPEFEEKSSSFSLETLDDVRIYDLRSGFEAFQCAKISTSSSRQTDLGE